MRRKRRCIVLTGFDEQSFAWEVLSLYRFGTPSQLALFATILFILAKGTGEDREKVLKALTCRANA